ncbi:MAG TPA: ribonuclease Z [Pseudogracilibacillus sp.]|nr:ribonuclease Z [Pseudogracilibacillus sp.]
MKLTFLGTGAGMPAKERNVSALVLDLLQEINEMWLFDCGEATQHQILYTSIKPRKINKVFISHLHGDHIFGLPGFLSSRSFLGGDSPLTVYGPKGIKDFIKISLQTSHTHIKYPLSIVELDEGVIYEDEHFIVEAMHVDHNVECFAYKVIEKDKLGELQVNKLRQLGVKPGPIYKAIKENAQTTLEDGSIIYRDDVIGPSKKGKVLAIFGDTRYDDSHINFIKDSDILVHEATFNKESQELAYEYYHSTTEEVANLAKQANVKTLIITHISSRYQDEAAHSLLEEVREVFPNSYIANDFYEFDIK